MRRIKRYQQWHRYNCKHIRAWQGLHDDGSLMSDRTLLLDMGVVHGSKVQRMRKVVITDEDVIPDADQHVENAPVKVVVASADTLATSQKHASS